MASDVTCNGQVGKWHLGSHLAAYSPTERGFTSHLGYWGGMQDYWDHTLMCSMHQGLVYHRGS